MWTLHKRQQHCGAQLPARERARQAGEVPAEATRDRDAQEHDRADLDAGGGALQPGDYPASAIEHRDDKAPSAPDGCDSWDEVVQPEQEQTELEQDERDDPAKRERAIGQVGDE